MSIGLSDSYLWDDVFLIDTIVDCIIRSLCSLRRSVELCSRNLTDLIGRDGIAILRIK